MSANIPKLKAAIAYFAKDDAIGKVKLFKLLYLADFTAYKRLGRSITDDTYEHFHMGPVPTTLWKNFSKITDECVDVELIRIAGLERPEQSMRTKPDLVAPLLGVLDDDDRRVLDEIDRQYGKMSGAQLRDLTHDDIPYKATVAGEDIPYSLAMYRNHTKPTKEEVLRILSQPISQPIDDRD